MEYRKIYSMKMRKNFFGICLIATTLFVSSAFSSLAEFGPGADLSPSGATSAAFVTTAHTTTSTGSDTFGQHTDGQAAIIDTTETMTSAPTGDDTKAEALTKTLTAQITDQIILVVDHSLALYHKQADGSWQKTMETYCGYGRNGLKAWNERHEGDQTTPVGSFPILHAFGICPNPGTQMSWRDVTPSSYWSGEQSTYNSWVESATPISGEHLSEYTICYKYAMAVGFNVNPTVYKRGSAIFLHCKNPAEWSSAGCVSVEEADMIALLQQCHNGCYMMIVPNEASIANF